MNDILNRVQNDWTKLQKTIEKESEVLVEKILTAANKAANNEKFVEKRQELEKLLETQYKKFEPTLDRLYKDFKGTAEKYGVNVQKIENGVIATTQRAARRFHWDLATAKAGAADHEPTVTHSEPVHEATSKPKKKAGRKKAPKKA